MNPSNSSPRRRRNPALGAEALEPRELLTGGAGNTFAIIPATITQVNGTDAIKFTIDPSHFTLPRRAFTLGIDVAPTQGSTIKPFIDSVIDPHGNIVPQTFHSIYNPHLTHLQVASGQGTSAVLTPITLYPHGSNKPATYTVNVSALGGTSGSFLVGFYLPGDATGNGVVDQADLQATKAAFGSKASSPNYNFEADVNRDGRIGQIDLAYVHQNFGVSTNITPVASANFDPASTDGAGTRTASTDGTGTRTASTNSAHFTGTATPGATITYTNSINNGLTTTTTADGSGNYSINVPLAPGVNTFTVSAADSFGQTISGTIAPVTYTPKKT